MKALRLEAAWPVNGGGFVAVGPDRRLWTINTVGTMSPFVALPVPGAATILAVDPESRQAVLGDGTRFGWFGRSWVALGEPAASEDGPVTMRVKALTSFCVEAGKDLAVGAEIDLPERRALELIRLGWVEPVAEPASR